nr:protein ZBED8-like [Parasteatoda tepidariorum]
MYISPSIQNELIEICGSIIQETIVDRINKASCFAILADETMDITQTEQLTFCARYIDVRDFIDIENLMGEMEVWASKWNMRESLSRPDTALSAMEECDNTKGKSIFDTAKDYFTEKNIPPANIMSIATDGANAMGRHRVFIALLKREIPDILAVYCVLHRQHLEGKNLSDRLHQSLQCVISAVNKIHSNVLND